jgi:hypothetical protein
MFALKEQVAKLTKFTPFTEMHGDVPVQGSTVTLLFNIDAKALVGFHEELRGLLYQKLGARSKNLADAGADLPDLRMERLAYPLKWRQRYEESKLTLHIGDVPEHLLTLSGKVVKPFEITPLQGGSVIVTMKFNCHPQGEEVTDLYDLQRNECRITFEPGKEVQDTDPDDDPPVEGGDE